MYFTTAWVDYYFHDPYASLEEELISERIQEMTPADPELALFLETIPALLPAATGSRALT
jgi:hypothetical protein